MDYLEIAKKVSVEAVASISPLYEKAFINSCKNKLNEKMKIDFQNVSTEKSYLSLYRKFHFLFWGFYNYTSL